MIKKNLTKKALNAHVLLMNKFIKAFGVLHGIWLFLLFKLKKLDNIKIPGILFPLSLRPGTTDVFSFNQIFLDNGYGADNLNNPSVIVDGGANIGLFAIKMKNIFPDAVIICVEPDPENFIMLEKNLAPYNGIFLEKAALWGHEGIGNLSDKHNLGKWGMAVSEDSGDNPVRLITIPSLFQKYNINKLDVLKLDIETAEKQVFATEIHEWFSKVKNTVIELHDWIEPGCASVFFNAVNQVIKEYKYLINGEHTIIINLDIE